MTRKSNGMGLFSRLVGSRRRIVALVAALLAVIAGAWFYTGGGEEAPVRIAAPITEFSCTSMSIRTEDGIVECFEGPSVAILGIAYRAATHKAPLELLVIGDALQCTRTGRHASGATEARCKTSDGVDLACAMDPANIALRDVRTLCGGTGADPLLNGL